MRVRLVVAYDGTNYHGWQIQNNAISVEEVLQEALRELLREPVELIGASRTDAGVHAQGNVAVFDTDTRIPAEKIAIAVNQRLPEDIRVMKSEQVEETFHPRYAVSEKTYEYRISNVPIQLPTERLYSYFVYPEFYPEYAGSHVLHEWKHTLPADLIMSFPFCLHIL